jgi:hypothetical protein
MEVNYLKLLKYEKELKSKGKSLSKENEQDYKKLLKYEVSLLDHFKWEQKDRYFLLITNFLDKKIDIDQYICQLFKLGYEIQNLVEELKLDFEKLKEFKPNSVSKGLSKLIEKLCSDCRVVEPDPNLRGDFEISETQLINSLRKKFLQIQEY